MANYIIQKTLNRLYFNLSKISSGKVVSDPKQDKLDKGIDGRFDQLPTNYNASLSFSRLDRYRDYECISGDTIIPTPDRNFFTVKELYERYKDSNFHVFSYDLDLNEIRIGNACSVVNKGVQETYKVSLSGGKYIVATKEHLFLLATGEYKKLEDLQIGESLMAFSRDFKDLCIVYDVEFYRKEEVFDITVDKYHNFATDSCFVHNCIDSQSAYASTALDIYASDASQFDRFIGASVWVTSEDRKLAKELNRFLQEILQVEDNVYQHLRGIAKYGSIKVRLIGEPKKGLISAKDMNNDIFIIRIENKHGVVLGYNNTTDWASMPQYGTDQDIKVDFMPYEIGHPRLKGRPFLKTINDKNSPLLWDIPTEGMSMIENARLPIRNYELLKEALMVYRISHAIDRMNYKIDLTGKAPDEGIAYMREFAKTLKKRVFVDEKSGKVNLLHNLPSYLEDMFTPIWQNNLTSQELIKAVGDVYSIEDLKILQKEIEGALKFPPGYLFSEDGASIVFNKHTTQDNLILARYVESLQKAYIRFIVMACQIHMAYKGEFINAKDFRVNMSPVSDAAELGKIEILTNLISNATSLISLGEQLGIDKTIWNKYVMRLTLNRIDFGEVVDVLGYQKGMDTAKVMATVKEAFLDKASEFSNLSLENYKALEANKELFERKDFKNISEEMVKMVDLFTSQGIAEEYKYNSTISSEVNEFQSLGAKNGLQSLVTNVREGKIKVINGEIERTLG